MSCSDITLLYVHCFFPQVCLFQRFLFLEVGLALIYSQKSIRISRGTLQVLLSELAKAVPMPGALQYPHFTQGPLFSQSRVLFFTVFTVALSAPVGLQSLCLTLLLCFPLEAVARRQGKAKAFEMVAEGEGKLADIRRALGLFKSTSETNFLMTPRRSRKSRRGNNDSGWSGYSAPAALQWREWA